MGAEFGLGAGQSLSASLSVFEAFIKALHERCDAWLAPARSMPLRSMGLSSLGVPLLLLLLLLGWD